MKLVDCPRSLRVRLVSEAREAKVDGGNSCWTLISWALRWRDLRTGSVEGKRAMNWEKVDGSPRSAVKCSSFTFDTCPSLQEASSPPFAPPPHGRSRMP